MKVAIGVVVLLLSTAFTFLAMCRADVDTLDLPNQADVICLATPVAIVEMPLHETSLQDRVFFDPSTYIPLAVKLHVMASIKGPGVGEDITLVVHKLKPMQPGTTYSIAGSWSDLRIGQSYLIFAASNRQAGDFNLINWSPRDPSAVKTDAIDPAWEQSGSLQLRLLTQIGDWLNSSSAALRMAALSMVGDYGYVLWDHLPQHLAETQETISNVQDLPAIKTLLLEVIRPAVLRLTVGSDDATRGLALYDAALLQSNDVLPKLLERVANPDSGDWETMEALSMYGTVSALPILVPLLSNPNPRVRASVTQSLDNMTNRLTIPYLLDAVNDSDPSVRTHAYNGLFDITNTSVTGGPPFVQGQDKFYVDYWNNWANEHQAEVSWLRKQSLHPSIPVPASGAK